MDRTPAHSSPSRCWTTTPAAQPLGAHEFRKRRDALVTILRSAGESKSSAPSPTEAAAQNLLKLYQELLEAPDHPAVGTGLDARVNFIRAEMDLLRALPARPALRALAATEFLAHVGYECETERFSEELFGAPGTPLRHPREVRRRIARTVVIAGLSPLAPPELRAASAGADVQRCLDHVMSATGIAMMRIPAASPADRKLLQRLLRSVFREDEVQQGVSRPRIRALHDRFCSALTPYSQAHRDTAWLALMERRWNHNPARALREVMELKSSPAWGSIAASVRFAPVLGAMDLPPDFDTAAAVRVLASARAGMSGSERIELVAQARAAGARNTDKDAKPAPSR